MENINYDFSNKDELKKYIMTNIQEYDLRINYEEDSNLIDNYEASKNNSPELWQEPRKNGAKIIITILGLILLFYIIFFGYIALTN